MSTSSTASTSAEEGKPRVGQRPKSILKNRQSFTGGSSAGSLTSARDSASASALASALDSTRQLPPVQSALAHHHDHHDHQQHPTHMDSTEMDAAKRLKWDEENLIETSLERGTHMKISEPKTPYIHYNHDTDEILGTSANTASISESMKPLDLNEPFEINQTYHQPHSLPFGQESQFVKDVAARMDERLLPEYQQQQQQQQHQHDWDATTSEEETDAMDMDGYGQTEEDQAKAREFAKKRLQHYNMAEALRKGKELLQSGAEDDDDDEDEDEA